MNDDLDDDDRTTALLVAAAFAGVRHSRPSPATSPGQDGRTAARVAAAFDGVRYAASWPAPSPAPGAGGELVALPAPPRRHRRRWLLLVAAAAAAAVVIVAAQLGPAGSSPAWAAQPRIASAADEAAVTSACSAPLARGLGELESSVSAAPGGGAPQPVPPDASGPQPPRSLPPLVALDLRGGIAFAVYQDRAWTVACVASAEGGGWRDAGVQVGPGTSGSQPGLVAAGGTSMVDGLQVTTVTGSVPAGATGVVFRLDDGTLVRASLRGTTWAAWFPGDRALDPASLTVERSQG